MRTAVILGAIFGGSLLTLAALLAHDAYRTCFACGIRWAPARHVPCEPCTALLTDTTAPRERIP